jgi:hypothetical protein
MQQPAFVHYTKKETSQSYGFLGMIGAGIVLAAVGLAIAVVAFVGVAACTCIVSVIVPSVIKISTWAIAASELKTCIALTFESLCIGAVIGVLKKIIHTKNNSNASYSIKTDKTIASSIIFSVSVGMAAGFLSGISGANGIIQSTLFNTIISPQSTIGMVIISGGAGGIAGGSGILLFLMLLLIFVIQGIIIGFIVGLFYASVSSIITAGVRHGFIETLIFSIDDSEDKYTSKIFVKYMLEGIIIGCLLSIFQGVITGQHAVKNYKTIKNTAPTKTLLEPKRGDVEFEKSFFPTEKSVINMEQFNEEQPQYDNKLSDIITLKDGRGKLQIDNPIQLTLQAAMISPTSISKLEKSITFSQQERMYFRPSLERQPVLQKDYEYVYPLSEIKLNIYNFDPPHNYTYFNNSEPAIKFEKNLVRSKLGRYSWQNSLERTIPIEVYGNNILDNEELILPEIYSKYIFDNNVINRNYYISTKNEIIQFGKKQKYRNPLSFLTINTNNMEPISIKEEYMTEIKIIQELMEEEKINFSSSVKIEDENIEMELCDIINDNE